MNALHMLDEPSTNEWLAFTKAATHMTYNEDNLDFYKPYIGGKCVKVGNGKEIEISYKGGKIVELDDNNKLHLKNVLVVPNIKRNVFSIRKLTKDFSFYI